MKTTITTHAGTGGVEIFHHKGYYIRSHGNGWAYTLFFPIEGAAPYSHQPTAWLQDDDATEFGKEYQRCRSKKATVQLIKCYSEVSK